MNKPRAASKLWYGPLSFVCYLSASDGIDILTTLSTAVSKIAGGGGGVDMLRALF